MSHYYHLQTKLREGNVFTPVLCFCSQHGGVSQHALGRGCVSQHAMGQEGCLPRGLSAWEVVCALGGCLPRGESAQRAVTFFVTFEIGFNAVPMELFTHNVKKIENGDVDGTFK